MNRLAVLSLMGLVAMVSAQDSRGMMGVRSLALSPDGDRLAFTWRGDVWVADSSGGKAIPLTTNIEMDDNPVWSPDGKTIAFASSRNGSWDIYTVPSDGGETKRLTFSGFSEIPGGYTPDGRSIVFRGFYERPEAGIYSINVQTGQLQLIWQDMRSIGFPKVSPNGKEVSFVRRFQFPWNRPRYEGSGAAQLNVIDLASGKREEVRANRFQHLWPDYAPDGRSLYAVTVTEKTPSTHNLNGPLTRYTDNADRTPNVYRINRTNGTATRLTGFVGGSGARFLTVAANSGLLAFERDGVPYTMMPGSAPKPIVLTGFIDDKTAIEERLVLTSNAEALSLSPKGDRFVFSVRRELWSVPTKQGRGPNASDATQLTEWEGSDTSPVYSADEKFMFFVSDRDGAERLYRMNLETRETVMITRTDHDVSDIQLTPDRKGVTFRLRDTKIGGVYMVATDSTEPKRILDVFNSFDYALSPDMRYIAYLRPLANSGFNPWENKANIFVRDLTTGVEVNATNLSMMHTSPAWSADGKFLYFRSDRDGGGIFALPTQVETARGTELELKYEKPTAPVKVEFDMTSPHLRIRRLAGGTVWGGLFSDSNNGSLIYDLNGDLWTLGYDGEGNRQITSGGGINSVTMSQDGNSMVFLRNGALNTLNLRANGFPIATTPFRADWTRDLRAERRAALAEFWRAYNQNFYDGNFHGRNWAEIRTRYAPLLDSVGHRNEMATVLNMMVGELESSHSEVSPGPGNPGAPSVAHLGVLFDYSYAGPGLRIAEVPARTPGTFAQTRLREGEYILSINGRDVRLDQSVWRALADQVGREVTLTVNSTPTKNGARTVKFRALSDTGFDDLVYRNRINANRGRVDRDSGGKVGYVHIAAMGGGDFAQFDAEVWQYIQGKQALIIDVRDNNGGNIADRLLDILERRPQMLYLPRDGEKQTGPGTAITVPIVVMINERSVSNGEMFPAAMKSRGLATTIGWETPGYVIYTSGGVLVDGTRIRMPGTGVYRLDGSPLENLGEVPQIRVDITPEQFFGNIDPQLERAIREAMNRANR